MKAIRRWEVLERFNGKVIVVETVDKPGIPRVRIGRVRKGLPLPFVREVASGIVYVHGQVAK